MPPRSRSRSKPEPPPQAPPDVYRPGEIIRTPRVKSVRIDVYKAVLFIMIGGSRRQSAAISDQRLNRAPADEPLPELTDDDLERMKRPTGTNWTLEGKPDAFIWIPKIPKTPWDFAVVTHEAVHVAVHICHVLGIKIEAPVSDPAFVNDEALTYLSEFIAREVFTFIEELTDEWKASRKSRR